MGKRNPKKSANAAGAAVPPQAISDKLTPVLLAFVIYVCCLGLATLLNFGTLLYMSEGWFTVLKGLQYTGAIAFLVFFVLVLFQSSPEKDPS